jgi:signal transduction histidine kinase
MAAQSVPFEEVGETVLRSGREQRGRTRRQLWRTEPVEEEAVRLPQHVPAAPAAAICPSDDTSRSPRRSPRRGRAYLEQTQALPFVLPGQGPRTLASRVTHDLRNLLTAISGFVDLALLDLPTTHPAHESLRMIERALHQGNALADAMGDFSRGESRVHARPKASPPAAGVRQPGVGECILVVEEDAHIRSIITTTLRAQGYEPVAVAQGAEATAASGPGPTSVRLVVLDLESSGQGCWLCLGDPRWIRDDLPVILVTDRAGNAPAGRLREREFLLRKPFRTVELAELVARALARPESARAHRC